MFPLFSIVIFHSYVNVYQRVWFHIEIFPNPADLSQLAILSMSLAYGGLHQTSPEKYLGIGGKILDRGMSDSSLWKPWPTEIVDLL